MKKIRIDGIEYDAGSEQAVAAQDAFQAKLNAEKAKRDDEDAKRKTADEKRDAELKALNDKFDKLQAKADADADALEKASKELKASPAKVKAELTARLSLEAQAAKILGNKAAKKFDALSDKELKLAVLKQTDPDKKFESKADAYIDARFDLAIEAFEAEGEEGGDDEHSDESGAAAARRGVRGDDEGEEGEPGDPSAEMSTEEAEAEHTDSATAQAAMEHRHRNEWKKPITAKV